MSIRLLTSSLKDTAVYWGTPQPDGMGGMTYAKPVEIKVRWLERAERFITAAGKEAVSRAQVFHQSTLVEDGYIELIDLADLGPNDSKPQERRGAFQIRKADADPTFKGDQKEKWVML